jgi:hypothetical protein
LPMEIADRDELLRLLTVRAREGSVAAMRVLLEELRRDARADAGDGWDEVYGDDNVRPIRRAS